MKTSTQGYKRNSPDRHRPFNIIPSGNITMNQVPHPVFGIDNTGAMAMMAPGANYQFPGSQVLEFPVNNKLSQTLFQQGGEPVYEAPKGYAPSTPEQRANWNRFLDYLQSQGAAGNTDLDARDKKLGLQYLNQYNQDHQDVQVPESFIPIAQYESYLIRKKNMFPGMNEQEAKYAFSNLPEAYRNRPISGVDNWLGSNTSKQYYPTFRRGKTVNKADGSSQTNSYDFNVNFEDYVRSMNDPKLQEKYMIPPANAAVTAKTFQKGGSPFWGTYGVAGMSFLANALEARNRNNPQMNPQTLGMTDSVAPVVPGSRGDYTTNEGYFRPDQYTPTQFKAIPYAQAGGFFDEPQQAGAGYIPGPPIMQQPVQAPDPVMTKGNMKRGSKDAALDAYRYYVQQKGIPGHIAAGIVGNLYQESGLKPAAKEKGNTGNGRGIAQWDVRDRWQGLLKWAANSRKDPYNLQSQLDYVLEEPGEGSKVMKRLARTTTPEQAAMVFGKTFERPSEKHARWDIRTNTARKLFTGK